MWMWKIRDSSFAVFKSFRFLIRFSKIEGPVSLMSVLKSTRKHHNNLHVHLYSYTFKRAIDSDYLTE